MTSPPLKSSIEENVCSVKPIQLCFNLQLAQPMIHHKPRGTNHTIIEKYRSIGIRRAYGVSSSHRVLSPQLFLKRFDNVRDCLQYTLGLTTAQREVTLRLLRYWSYYGQVYPKEAQLTSQPGCKKATFWRTIRVLENAGLITVVNRYVIRPHAQISNRYLFNKLLVIIARYLAEHGTRFKEKWLQPLLTISGAAFWRDFAFKTQITTPRLTPNIAFEVGDKPPIAMS